MRLILCQGPSSATLIIKRTPRCLKDDESIPFVLIFESGTNVITRILHLVPCGRFPHHDIGAPTFRNPEFCD
jgi:hypothetical protein